MWVSKWLGHSTFTLTSDTDGRKRLARSKNPPSVDTNPTGGDFELNLADRIAE
jgi:hypothetical protein